MSDGMKGSRSSVDIISEFVKKEDQQVIGINK